MKYISLQIVISSKVFVRFFLNSNGWGGGGGGRGGGVWVHSEHGFQAPLKKGCKPVLGVWGLHSDKCRDVSCSRDKKEAGLPHQRAGRPSVGWISQFTSRDINSLKTHL